MFAGRVQSRRGDHHGVGDESRARDLEGDDAPPLIRSTNYRTRWKETRRVSVEVTRLFDLLFGQVHLGGIICIHLILRRLMFACNLLSALIFEPLCFEVNPVGDESARYETFCFPLCVVSLQLI